MSTATNSESISSEVLLNVITRDKKNNGAQFTIKSNKTGKDYTYMIARKLYKGIWYTHVSVETSYQQFNYLGSYFKGRIYRKGGEITTPSAIGISFVLYKVERKAFAWLNAQIEVMHVGNCLCCGRILTDANSIKIGLGPVCAMS